MQRKPTSSLYICCLHHECHHRRMFCSIENGQPITGQDFSVLPAQGKGKGTITGKYTSTLGDTWPAELYQVYVVGQGSQIQVMLNHTQGVEFCGQNNIGIGTWNSLDYDSSEKVGKLRFNQSRVIGTADLNFARLHNNIVCRFSIMSRENGRECPKSIRMCRGLSKSSVVRRIFNSSVIMSLVESFVHVFWNTVAGIGCSVVSFSNPQYFAHHIKVICSAYQQRCSASFLLIT